MSTVSKLIAWGSGQLQESGIADPKTDARRLMQYVLGIDHAGLISASSRNINHGPISKFKIAIRRRCLGEPVSRICGVRSFYGLEFAISPAVLDPRPETEMLVDAALTDFAEFEKISFCDIGCGSGAIGVSLLVAKPGWRCTAIDISEPAIDVALANAARHRVLQRFSALRSDYLSDIESRFDFIVSNPPYIASDHINTLADDVRLHDPMIALDGGVDGLEAYRRIFSNAKNLLYRSGRLYLEIGWNQAEQCTEIGRENGWRRIDAKRDFGGNMRLLVFAPPNLEQEETIYRRKGLESDNEHATFSVVQG